MTSLAEKENLKGKVQMIFIDPPYGINFRSNWQVSTRKKVIKDTRTEDITRQPEQIKAYRDTWSKGIHSYLSYLRERFLVGRELLCESGVMAVQIGNENLHLVKTLLAEVFGESNLVGGNLDHWLDACSGGCVEFAGCQSRNGRRLNGVRRRNTRCDYRQSIDVDNPASGDLC